MENAKIKYLKTNSGIKILKCIGDIKNVTSVIIPDAIEGLPVTEISDYSFTNYENLSAIKIPDTVKSLGTCAFNGCRRLIEISLPDSATKIADGAFRDCKSLTAIKLPNVKKIGNNAFRGCINLSAVELPASAEIGDKAFTNCHKSLEIIWEENFL